MASQPVGICSLCGERKGKRAMARHLAECAPNHDPARGASAEWVHLRVEGGGPYWLDVEARSDATLADLDDLLRRLWLECCGHMSAFFVAGRRSERYSEYSMDAPVAAVFGQRGAAARYEYDFGSTTELLVRGLARRTARGGGKTLVRLLARNEAPLVTCDECGQPAAQICPFWEGENPFVCSVHADDHACEDADCHLPVVNSPRMGVCGYTG